MKESFTYREIQEALPAAQQLGALNAPQKTAYRLARIIEKLKIAGKEIGKAQLELYKIYGHEKTPGKGDWNIPEDKLMEFIPVMDSLMDMHTIEIDFMPVACNMFTAMSASNIVAMGRFMVEEEIIITK
jgi:hypothetical protein